MGYCSQLCKDKEHAKACINLKSSALYALLKFDSNITVKILSF